MAEVARQEKQIIEDPQRPYGSEGEQVFDNRVHIRNAETGRLIRRQHYAMHAFSDKKIWERPIGSGNMFDAHGDPIGRWKRADKGHWEQISKEHSAVPMAEKIATPDELIARNSELESELAALKADLEMKTAPVKSHGKA